ncbi:hypothetical protein, partial [Escherichia coli]|uniref:hypothetical protein n=1 Tax=Escherichia coli TaxID=562 RepID=UPI0035E454D8
RVEIPTYETGPQDIHPMFLENRVYQGSSGAVYPYGATDTLSEQKTLQSWQVVVLENEYNNGRASAGQGGADRGGGGESGAGGSMQCRGGYLEKGGGGGGGGG